MAGYELKRDASQQQEQGELVAHVDDAKKGDLVFLKNRSGVNHVGIALNEKEIIHASGKVRVDRLEENGIFNVKRNCYTHEIVVIKRVIIA